MFNEALLNTTLLNDRPLPDSGGLPLEEARFNNFGLHNSYIKLESVDHWDMPDRDFNTTPKPTRNGRLVTSDAWNSKTIVLSGYIYTESREQLDTKIFEVKKNLAPRSGNLDIKLGDGSYRRYVSTCTSIDIPRTRSYHIGWCPIVMRFDCLNPFGTDINPSSGLFQSTETNFNFDIEVGGNIDTKPLIVMVCNTLTNTDKLTIKNNTTDQEIYIETTFNNGDIIVLDSNDMSFKNNFVELGYYGSFPDLMVGVNSFNIKFESTAELEGLISEYSLTCKFFPSYL